MKEIVGANINGTITNNPGTIREALSTNIPIAFIDRKHIQFMAAAGLGKFWEIMAESKTLFLMEDDGRLCRKQNTKRIVCLKNQKD